MESDKDTGPEASADEIPPHEVVIARSFGLARYPVTFEEYARYARETGRKLLDGRGRGRGRDRKRRSVINLTWKGAKD